MLSTRGEILVSEATFTLEADAKHLMTDVWTSAGVRRFISVHMLFPGKWTVHHAHNIAEDFERDIRVALGDAIIHAHLEPIDDEISMTDVNEQPTWHA